MTYGEAIVTFGYDTTFMVGGTAIYNDDPVVTLNLRTREPGPITDSEKEQLTPGRELDSSDFNVTILFKSVESIDNLIGLLTVGRDELNVLLNKGE